AAKFFHANLKTPEGQAGREYWLQKRRLDPRTVTHFGLGYAQNSWTSLRDHLQAQGFTYEELEAANLVRRNEKNGRTSYYDNFRHRVMVPILDLRGNVTAFGGRVLDDSKPKYINTSDTLAYKKGHDIFALHFAKNTAKGRLILCEGYMDVIALHQYGFTQAVACLGTALTREQAQLLTRYCGEVVLCYDADEAGQKAVQRALHVLEQTNLKIRVIRLHGGKDPDEVLNTFGAERFRQLLESAANDIEYQLLLARGSLDLQTPAGKAAYIKEAAKVLGWCSAVELDIYAGRLGQELEVDKQAILLLVQKQRKHARLRHEQEKSRELLEQRRKHNLQVDPERETHPAAAAAEERILGLLLKHPDFYRKARDKLTAEDFVTRFNRQLAEALFARLKNEQGVTPELLTGALCQNELDECMRMLVHSEEVANPLMEFEGCVAKLLAEKTLAAHRQTDLAQLDDESYAALFAGLKQAPDGVF
ncbi:MAG: toprim domain-containing protein, partial [Oscillospiraceae bacterium]|nr:toprim domain-containing protein [Oscillospiraceae bacterium]